MLGKTRPSSPARASQYGNGAHSEDRVKALLPKNRRVILDLTDLGYMDSSGLGTLVGLYISAKGANCRLELVNLSPRIRELLSLTNVLSIFEAS